MTWNDLALCRSHKLLQPLGGSEPRWVVSSKPPLWDSITPLLNNVSCCPLQRSFGKTYILNNVAMVTNEQVGATVLQIDLHADQSVCVTWQMV